jgi:hypothetical protein
MLWPHRRLGGNAQMSEPDRDIARAFTEAEASGDRTWWTRNSILIGARGARFARALDPAERVAFYQYLMRHRNPPAVADAELPRLHEAYVRLQQEPPRLGVRAHVLTYLFGGDLNGPLPSGRVVAASQLKARLAVMRVITASDSLSGQRRRAAKYAALADHAPVLLETLRHLDYRVDEDLFHDLPYWGMLLTLVLAPATRIDVLTDLLDTPGRPCPDRTLVRLDRTVAAVVTDPTDPRLTDLRTNLANRARTVRDRTEAGIWAHRLGLRLPGDWGFAVEVPIVNDHENPEARLRLTIQPSARNSWQVELYRTPRIPWREDRTGRTIGHRPDSLADFPRWARSLYDLAGLYADLAGATVRTGGNRTAAATVRRWLTT